MTGETLIVRNRILGGLFDGVTLETEYKVLEEATETEGAKVMVLACRYINLGDVEEMVRA